MDKETKKLLWMMYTVGILGKQRYKMKVLLVLKKIYYNTPSSSKVWRICV
jgi:hypothetical protein